MAKSYQFNSCLGDERCDVIQTDCVIRMECKTILQDCQGLMVGRELNMTCNAVAGGPFQMFVNAKEDHFAVTVIKDNKVCQGKWTE